MNSGYFSSLAGIKVVVADMLDLPFDSESFDIVIEKGTMVCQLRRPHHLRFQFQSFFALVVVGSLLSSNYSF